MPPVKGAYRLAALRGMAAGRRFHLAVGNCRRMEHGKTPPEGFAQDYYVRARYSSANRTATA